MGKYAIVACGGALGSVLRYAVAQGLQRTLGSRFPWGTLGVNVSGCLLIGILWGLFFESESIRDEYRLALVVGLLGGYTTFSAFGLETFQLLVQGRLSASFANVAANCVLGLSAVWLGVWLARRFAGA